jgi:hypothetical protein
MDGERGDHIPVVVGYYKVFELFGTFIAIAQSMRLVNRSLPKSRDRVRSWRHECFLMDFDRPWGIIHYEEAYVSAGHICGPLGSQLRSPSGSTV